MSASEPKMVNTRSTIKKTKDAEKEASSSVTRPSNSQLTATTKITSAKSGASSVVKSEQHCIPPATITKAKSKQSSTSSMIARRKKMELEAAEAKARIEMQLIEKKLEADIADLEEKYSHQSEVHSTGSEIERWLEHSQHELETQRVPDKGKTQDPLQQPAVVTSAGTNDGTVQLLASALKDLAAASVTNGNNANLLSRICTPRDLPPFSGDPMEWLQFKQAYEESTQVCNFSPKENLWRLRKCLRGPARDAVTALLISATSPDIVISTLELQFGNPETIIARIMLDIKKLHPVSQDYHRDIVPFSVKVQNYVAAVHATGRDEYLQGINVSNTILSKLPAVLISKWADYSYPLITTSKKPRLEILAKFLNEEAIKISATSINALSSRTDLIKRKHYDGNTPRTHSVLLQNVQADDKCRYCRVSKHNLPDCKRFKKSLRKYRWSHVKRYGLCYKCLVANHSRDTCPEPMCDIDGCGQPHHRLLHYPFNKECQQSDTVNIVELPTQASECLSETVAHMNIKNCSNTVLLKVVPINIHGPNGIISTSALLDDGSTISLISTDLVNQLGATGRRQTIRATGAWNNSEIICETQIVNLSVSNRDGEMFDVQMRSAKELNIPVQNIHMVNYKRYLHINEIIDNLYRGESKPQILIGQDNYHLMVPLETKIGKVNEPCATLTPLGWCVHGRAHVQSPSQPRQMTFLLTDDAVSLQMNNERLLNDIQEMVRYSFTLDSMGITSKPRQNTDELRALACLEQTTELVEGGWQTGLPWRNDELKMPDSYPIALKRLRSVEEKMNTNEEYSKRYKERISHLFDNNYAKEVINEENTKKTWYLPHFGVDNPNKKKLRLVFDAAAKTNGLCLNDYLLKGPDLLMSLLGIMFRFREDAIAVTGDIRDMFLRVKIRPEDQDALRFLWRNNPEESEKTYAMTSLIFGANCSPFVAQYVKNKNAERYESSMPAAVEAIHKQHYMDDYIHSLPDTETALKLVNEITYIHKQGNFEIRNWASNSKELLDNLPKETLSASAVRFNIGNDFEGERTLGLIWNPSDDTLQFDVTFKKIPDDIMIGKRVPTKREMLRVIMTIFDVYGFLSPYTINGKILLQDSWRQKVKWDENIPDEVCKKWCEWINQVKTIRCIKLPRCYQSAVRASGTVTGPTSERERTSTQVITAPPPPQPAIASYTNLQLHVFCDASTQAMCAVAYWRWSNNNNILVAFIASKCRVAPVKPVSVPRLELQAALLAARLAETIKKEHKMNVEHTYFWSDSSTVLHWIQNDARSYKTFVAHRLGEIDELTNKNEWRYVPTNMNVADIATRESYECTILQNEWFNGPEFLNYIEDMWPENIISMDNVNNNNLEYINVIQRVKEDIPVPDSTRFSSWLRLLRATSAMLKFVKKCRGHKCDENTLMEQAERLLIRKSQNQSFSDEIFLLRQNKNLESKSKLLTLSPYLDQHGVLRAGGRIDAAAADPEMKRPTILDGGEHITRLIVKSYHINAAHGHQETVVNELKQKYWVLRVRPTVKYIASSCMFCRIRKAKPEIPRMGDLPGGRMAHHQRPFTFCGVDLFGPLEVTVKRHREKRYGVLFTCLTVRAVHIEVVNSLTSDSLIMALRRMAARRGWPQHLYSDNGTNLRGADKELKNAICEMDEKALAHEAVNKGMRWTFIPPASPHWGGAWERLVRSIKTSLKIILKEQAPKEETLITLLAESENIVNSRPLVHVSVEPGCAESLTPNHFLIGSSSGLPQLGKFDDSDLYLRRQWRIAQRLTDLFWKRWLREVLPEMIPRQKWNQEQRPLKVGDLVLVVDPDAPRNVWPRGLIQEVFPGRDGRVRMVKVRTKSKELMRSAARVARIPMDDECCHTSTRVGIVSDAPTVLS